jgi:hypothetical protein
MTKNRLSGVLDPVATLDDQLPRFADRKDLSGPYRLPLILPAR